LTVCIPAFDGTFYGFQRFKEQTEMRANILLLVMALVLTVTAKAEEVIVFENVNAIDAVDGLRKGMTVIVRGSRIAKIGAAASVQVPGNATTIDGAGKYLIPGLWDSHVHLTFERDVTPAMFRLFLANGITSIRDTGGLLDLVLPLREEARRDAKNCPRVMVAGPLLDGVPTVYDGKSRSRPKLSVGAASVSEAEALVDKFSAAGVDLIKAYEMLSPAAFKATIRRANSKGLQVTGHVPLSMDVISASNAGLRSMEHLRNLEMSCSRHAEQLLEERRRLLEDGANELGGVLRSRIHRAQRTRALNTQDATTRDDVLRVLAANATWQIPTLTIVTSHGVHAQPEWRETFKYLPETAHRRWTENMLRRTPAPRGATRGVYAEWAFDMVGRMSERGIGIMAGTDCPIAYLTPGFSLHEELKLMAKCGLTPMQILEAATLKPAQYFKMETEIGAIRENMLADLVLLDANPLQDIANTSKINAVVRDGKLHDRRALDQMLEALETE
jgi:imidazolonepropionase-like amidohydrolase